MALRVNEVVQALEEANKRKIARAQTSPNVSPEPKSLQTRDVLPSLEPSVEPQQNENVAALSENNSDGLDHFKKFVGEKTRGRRPTHKKFVGQDVASFLLAQEAPSVSMSSPALVPTPGQSVPSSIIDADIPVNIGDVLRVDTASGEQVGKVRFLGPTFFGNPEVATGEWIGLELETPDGKNDGSVKGTRYFTCEPLYGIFVQRSRVRDNLSQRNSETSLLLPTMEPPNAESPSQTLVEEPPKTPNRNYPWVKLKSDTSDTYYWNEATDATTWLRPESFFDEEDNPVPVLSPTGIETALIQEAMAAQEPNLPHGQSLPTEQGIVEWAERDTERALAERALIDKIEVEQAARRVAEEERLARQNAEQTQTGADLPTIVSATGADAPVSVSPWTVVDSGNGSFYYWNEETDETTWEKPADFVAVPQSEHASTSDLPGDTLQVASVQTTSSGENVIEESVIPTENTPRNFDEEKLNSNANIDAVDEVFGDRQNTMTTADNPALDLEEEEEVWEAVENADGTVYYWNRETDETTWQKPADFGRKPVVVVKVASPTASSEPPTQAIIAEAQNVSTQVPTSEPEPNTGNGGATSDAYVPSGWQQPQEDSSDLSDEDAGHTRKVQEISAPSQQTLASEPLPPLASAPAPTLAVSPPAPKSAWRMASAEDGKVYYWHRDTGETTWARPAGYVDGDDSSDVDSDGENVQKTSEVAVHTPQEHMNVEQTMGSQVDAPSESEKLTELQQAFANDAAQQVEKETREADEEAKKMTSNANVLSDVTALSEESATIVAEAAQNLGPWIEVDDGTGNIYYWNEDTDETTWTKPSDFVEARGDIAEKALRKVEEEFSEPPAHQNPFDAITAEVRSPISNDNVVDVREEAQVANENNMRLVAEEREIQAKKDLEEEEEAREKFRREQLEEEARERIRREQLEQEEAFEQEKRRREHEEAQQALERDLEASALADEAAEKQRNEAREKSALEGLLARERELMRVAEEQAHAAKIALAVQSKPQMEGKSMSTDQSQGKSLEKDVIPLSNFVDNWLAVAPLMAHGVPTETEGPLHALNAALVLLKDLWFLEDQTWLRLRNRVKIGIVKDTKLYGNTSVSMGAAKLYGKPGGFVGFLNCGTGGIKYQMYSWEEGLRLSAEYKPKNGASPQNVQMGSYKPANAVSIDEVQRQLQSELSHPELPWSNLPDVPVFAFVTGTARNHWEEADSNEQAAMEAEMQRLFEDSGVRCLNNTYFLSSEEEGRLELVGCNAMYANLVAAGLLPPGTEVVGSFGIGRGSCQWAIARGSQVDTIGYSKGMSSLKELAGVGPSVISTYRQHPEKLFNFLQTLANSDNPVIALKSGCCLLIETKEYAHVKSQLTATPRHPLRRVRIARNGSTRLPEEFTWMGTLDRLCAEAAHQFKLDGNFPLIYKEDGKVLASVEELTIFGNSTESPLLILAALGEPFISVLRNGADQPRPGFNHLPQTRGPPPPLPPWDDDIPRKLGFESVQGLWEPLPCPVCNCATTSATRQ